MTDIFIQGLCSFFACLFFAIIYNTPKKELVRSGVTGGIGYAAYYYFLIKTSNPIFSTFVGISFIVLCAKIFEARTKIPAMVYILPAIFPLVPGANMYYAVHGILTDNISFAIKNAVDSFKLSGITVVSLIIGMSVPVKLFKFKILKK